jgi:hypothetical protein
MSVAIQPRVEDEPRATAIRGWLVASAALVCGSRGMGMSPVGGHCSARAEQQKSRKSKKESSFLKKRTKKLLSLEDAPTAVF